MIAERDLIVGFDVVDPRSSTHQEAAARDAVENLGEAGGPYGDVVPSHALTAFMFGRFRLYTFGRPIANWNGGKPRLLPDQ